MQWYWGKDGQAVGPMTFEMLSDVARRGELDPDDYVWHPRAGTWKRADSVAALWGLPPPRSARRRSLLPIIVVAFCTFCIVLGLAAFGILLVTKVTGTDVSTLLMFESKQSQISATRSIKRDCAFGDYQRGNCR